ncbi:hypothetical protein BGZ73_000417 [Actinomortierella ambigua]|nr:hypothetical protein BGZ73_000417 [Actinomortierella ambigua]
MPPYTVAASMDQPLAHNNWGDLAVTLTNVLPYSSSLSAEAADMLNDIIHHFNICLQAQDWAPGAAFWAKQLNKFLDLKYTLPLETRISFAKVFFELTIAPGMEIALVEHWARYCQRLIKKKKLIGPKDLTLPWRPLYELLERVLFTKNRQRALLSESKRMASVVQLVGHAQRFFPQTASREILEEFLPRFSTGDLPELLKAQSYLSTFLPTHNLQTLSPPEWLPTIFKVWSMVMRSNDFDRNFLSLVARTAEDNVGTYPLFSQSQIRAIFSAGMRTMDLPVGSNAHSAGTVDVEIGILHRAVARQDIRLRMFAKFIVYTINPCAEADSPKDSSLAHLSDLIQATESFYHPSNLGNWTGPLASFVQTLAWEWLKRLNDEKEESCTVPQDLRMTQELSDKFVEMIRGVTFLLMFSKDRQSVGHSHEALRLLAWISPTKVIPGVLDRAYPSLESLTETHRTTSVISALGALALPMLNRDNFPQGGKHLTPLLQLTIPGIDPNDPVKSLVTMMFVSSSLMTVPVYDLSSTSAGGSPIDWGGMEEESYETGEKVDMELEDAKRRASTIEFEEWLAKFLRRIIVLFENFPDDNIGSGRGATEKSLQTTATYTFDILFNNLSPQLRERAAKTMVDFITETPLTNASKATSMLISTWASTYREACLKKLWPICEREIRSEIEHGASSIPSVTYSDIQRDKTLFFYQQILNKAVASSEVLGHRQEIASLATYMIEKCQGRRGFQLGAKLLGNTLISLLSIIPLDMRACDTEQLNDPVWISESHKYWGQIAEPGVDKIEWYIPKAEHIAFALELIDQFLVPAIAKARDIMATYESSSTSGKQVSIELCKTLTILKAFVKSMVNLVDDDGDSPVSQSQPLDEIGSTAPNKPLEAMYLLKDKSDPKTVKVRKIRHELGQVLHELMTFFSKSREDDVENIKLLVKATGIFMANRGVDRSEEENQRRGYLYLKRTVAMPGDRKLMYRILRIRRAYGLHLQRLRLNAAGRPKTILHDSLLEDLAEFSLGRYTEVRKAAQQALVKSLKCFQGAKALVLPKLLKALESDNQDSDRMKGALFLLSTRSLMLPLLRDWKYAPDYICRLINAHHQDKPSIQMQIRRNFMEYLTNLTNLSLRVLVGTSLLQARSHFAAAHRLEADPDVTSRLAAKVKTRRLNDHKAFDNLMAFLTESARSPTLHWRYQTMAISVLEVLNRPEFAPSPELTEYYTRAVLSEMSPIRRIAISSLTTVLVHIKLRTFAKDDVYSLVVRKSSNPLRRTVTLPDDLPDNFTWEYLKKSVTEIDETHPESSLLDDSVATGWLVWPKTFKAYLPRANDFEFPEIEQDSQAAYSILETVFSQKAFWTSLMTFMSQEPARSDAHDTFTSEHARLYKSIFGLWEDRFLFGGNNDLVAPIAERLCQQTDDKNCQRAAAELMAGLIRGSKHWRKPALDRLWHWAIPLLKRTLQSCTPDALTYWERFVHYSCAQRDPRRVLPLISLIFGTPLDVDSTAAFAEAKNLYFTNAVRLRCSWRISSLTPSLRVTLLGHVAHPYKQVREILGMVLNGLFQDAFHPSYKNVRELLLDHQTHQPENVESTRLMSGLDERSRRQIIALKDSLEKWRAERVPSAQGSSPYSNAGKTVLSWMNAALSGARIQATYGLLYPLFSEVLQMQDVADDQDLQQLATVVLWKMAKLVFPPSHVPDLVELFCKTLHVATTSNWHIRNNLLPVVQIFFFTNLFSMQVDMMVQVMDAISGMLLDPQIEVRQLAAKTLAGIVRCSQRDATKKLISNFETLLSTPLPSRKRAREAKSSEGDVIGKKAPLPEGYSDAVLKRHAGVLGLAALLEAFPYEVPSWMPSVMVRLADFQSDPPPISTTVKKAFADFRRTHQDTWHEDQKMFGYDQLEVLSNMLISPSYYA